MYLCGQKTSEFFILHCYMNIINLTSLDQPGAELFSGLTESQLRHHREVAGGLFIVESPKVIRVALAAGYEPLALLCERRHLAGDAADIVRHINIIDEHRRLAAPHDWQPTPVYTGDRDLLARMTGYTLTRGVLCAMRRRPLPSVADVCRGAHRLAVIDGVVDTTNVGAIFRSAAALGIDGVLLTPNSCDPLCRRAVRVSMGSVFLLPWTWLDGSERDMQRQLNELGFRTAAMALTDRSVGIDDPQLASEPRLAIVLGTEGDGLPHQTIIHSDYVVRIPMHHGVDSLNVAAASAVAFWQLRQQ
jgi:tRNA G18 (ribose-2'-O)-methylase SpoU